MGISKGLKGAGIGCLSIVLLITMWFVVSYEVLSGNEIPGYILSKSNVKYKYFTMSSYMVQTDEIPLADPSTFEIIEDTFHKNYRYGKDKDRVYFRGQVIDGADPSTFEVTSWHMARDAKSIFRGKDIINK